MEIPKYKLAQTFILFLLLTSCKQRTPNIEFFSKLCDIRIPEKAFVIKNSDESFALNSSRTYEIRLTENDFKKLSQSIRKSGFYTNAIKVNENYYQTSYKSIGGNKAAWYRIGNKYFFVNTESSDDYKAEIDTITHIAAFTKL